MPGSFSKSETTVEATDAVLQEVERMRQAPPTDEELSLAKDSYLNSFVFNFDTKREILSRLMTYEYYDYPTDFLQQTKEGIETVEASDVQRVAEAYLHPNEAHVLIVGKREDFSDSLSTLTTDGSVNEIDVSIPTSPPGGEEEEPVSAEAQKAGRAALQKAKQALGGDAIASVENLTVVSEQNAQTPQGEMTINLEVTRAVPDKFFIRREMPQGTIEIAIDGDEGQMKTPRGTQAMPASAMERFKGQLWRDLAYLMSNLDHEELAAQDRGTETVEGTSYRSVKVTPPEGAPFTLYLDPESMRPARMSFQAQTQQGPTPSTSVYRSYETVDGVRIPKETVTYRDGEKAATTTVQEVSVNGDVSSDLFTFDDAASE